MTAFEPDPTPPASSSAVPEYLPYPLPQMEPSTPAAPAGPPQPAELAPTAPVRVLAAVGIVLLALVALLVLLWPRNEPSEPLPPPSSAAPSAPPIIQPLPSAPPRPSASARPSSQPTPSGSPGSSAPRPPGSPGPNTGPGATPVPGIPTQPGPSDSSDPTATGVLRGKVIDREGNPLPDVRIQITRADPTDRSDNPPCPLETELTTDAAGGYQTELCQLGPGRGWHVSVVHEGELVEAQVYVNSGQNTTYIVEFPPPAPR